MKSRIVEDFRVRWVKTLTLAVGIHKDRGRFVAANISKMGKCMSHKFVADLQLTIKLFISQWIEESNCLINYYSFFELMLILYSNYIEHDLTV